MANKPISTPLPADLPENWTYGQTVAPSGSEAGLSQQYGYNYLMQQVNAAQEAANTINDAFTGLASSTDLSGYIPTSQKGAASGVASLDGTGKIPTAQIPALPYDASGSASAVQSNLTAHISNQQNPHNVTAAQAGADPAGTATQEVATHNQSGTAHADIRALVSAAQSTADAAQPSIITITLTTSWTPSGNNYQQAVSTQNITENTLVDLLPDAATVTQMANDGVTALIPQSGTNVITIIAVGAQPSAQMTISAALQEVSAS